MGQAIPVSEQRDAPPSAHLNRVSEDLSRSLKRCHVLLDDYRAQLKAANSNDHPFLLSGDQTGEDEPSDT
jgi:hypothetical protein